MRLEESKKVLRAVSHRRSARIGAGRRPGWSDPNGCRAPQPAPVLRSTPPEVRRTSSEAWELSRMAARGAPSADKPSVYHDGTLSSTRLTGGGRLGSTDRTAINDRKASGDVPHAPDRPPRVLVPCGVRDDLPDPVVARRGRCGTQARTCAPADASRPAVPSKATPYASPGTARCLEDGCRPRQKKKPRPGSGRRRPAAPSLRRSCRGHA